MQDLLILMLWVISVILNFIFLVVLAQVNLIDSLKALILSILVSLLGPIGSILLVIYSRRSKENCLLLFLKTVAEVI